MVLGAALGLSACGGDSDSSGDSRFESEVIPAKFQGLPNCVVDKDSFNIDQDFFLIPESMRPGNDTPTCLVKVPNLNNGRTFSLACGPDLKNNDETSIYYQISEDMKGDLRSIGDDIAKYIQYLEDDNATTSTSKYGYFCGSPR